MTSTAFAVPAGRIPYWARPARRASGRAHRALERFGEQVLAFSDPDGLGIELIETATASPERAYTEGPVPVESAIHGFHSASLTEGGYQRTASLLTDTMGFHLVGAGGQSFPLCDGRRRAAG